MTGNDPDNSVLATGKRSPKAFFGIVFFTFLLALTQLPVCAGSVIKGAEVDRLADGPIDDDLILTGRRVELRTPVAGDVAVLARYATLDTTIHGALVVCSQGLTIDGEIEGSALLFCSEVAVDGVVKGTVGAMVGNFNVSEDAVLERDMYVLAEEVYLAGRMERDVTVTCGYVGISGEIEGDVSIQAEEVEILDGAVIGGDLKIAGCEDPQISAGAEVLGEVTIEPKTDESEDVAFWGEFAATVFFYFSLFVVGVLVVLVSRRHYTIAAEAITRSSGRSLAFGILGFGVGIGLFIILVLTLVGALAAFLTLAALLLFMAFLGQLYTAGALGSLLLSSDSDSGAGRWIGALFIGLAILAIATQIPIVGWLIYLFSGIVGLGGFIVAFLRCRAVNDPSVNKYLGEPSAG